MMKKLFLACSLAAMAVVAFAQDARTVDLSQIPSEAVSPQGFAPRGWKMEAVAKGDLNGDGAIDNAITMIEDIPFDPKDRPGPDRNRMLIVVLKDAASGQLKRVAVATRLLPCTSCGGAFYGVMDAPSNVSILKGVIVVGQDHGSREVSESTFRFRYDKAAGRVVLIGYDYNSYDRANGDTAKESTNYVTGIRVTTTGKGKRAVTRRKKVTLSPIYMDSIDGDEVEYAAVQRLGLG